jgi:hypothetical protein
MWRWVCRRCWRRRTRRSLCVGLFSLPPFLAYSSLPPQQNERNASAMTKKLMKHFSDAMSSYIDSNAKITHEKLGEEIENRLEDSKFWKKLNLGDGVRFSLSLALPDLLLTLSLRAVRDRLWRLVLLAHYPIRRKLRPQVFGSNGRSKAQAWCYPLLARYPLQVVLQQRWPYLHDRPYLRSSPFFLLLLHLLLLTLSPFAGPREELPLRR